MCWTKLSHSYLDFSMCVIMSILHFTFHCLFITSRGEPDRTVDRKTETAGPSWNWISYSSRWIPFLSWRFGSLQTYRASEQWEECSSGSGIASPLPLRLSTPFRELFMTSVPTLFCQQHPAETHRHADRRIMWRTDKIHNVSRQLERKADKRVEANSLCNY